MEIAAVNNRIFCSMLRIERFQSHDPTASKLKRETMREPVKDVFDTQFVGEDEVFDFICKLGVLIEVQEDFDAAKECEYSDFLYMHFNVALGWI